jgi:biotin transport system substrate-specific component
MESSRKKKISVYDLCSIAIGTAVIAALAQVSIPLAAGVPLTLQTFAIPLVAITLGGRNGAITALVYVLLGAIGVPVFARFSGGFSIVAGPTGGYILSFPIMAFLIGWGADSGSKIKLALSLIVGSFVNLGMGTIWLGIALGLTPQAAFIGGFATFIAVEIIKMMMAYTVGQEVRHATRKVRVNSR